MRTERLFRSILLGVLLAGATSADARRGVPPTVELDGCVMPSTKCSRTSDIVNMVVDDKNLPFAVETLRFVTTTSASSGKVLTELRLRPLRVHGPKELTQKLEVGSHQRLRGALRLGSGYLLLMGVDPLGEKP
jgi:hypothetical protein